MCRIRRKDEAQVVRIWTEQTKDVVTDSDSSFRHPSWMVGSWPPRNLLSRNASIGIGVAAMHNGLGRGFLVSGKSVVFGGGNDAPAFDSGVWHWRKEKKTA